MRRYVALSIILMMFLSDTTLLAQDQQKKTDKLTGKKIVMIIAKRMFEEVEFKEPKDIFDREGADVTIASSTLSQATGGNLRVQPDILIDNITVNDYDAVIFIGGFGVSEYFNNYQAHRIAKQALDQDKILGAICMAPRILVNAGILKGKRATAYETSGMEDQGVIVSSGPVERDGNIITANGPGAATQFGEAIVSALSK